MKNVHLLPTDKPSRLFITDNKLFNYHKPQQGDGVKIINQNIYITSDEEIKEEDWYYLPRTNSVHNKCIEDPAELNLERRLGVAKIILTTDQDLIANGVQAIDDEFLEWFVKNPSCEEVDVVDDENITDDGMNIYSIYKIIIPKEEPFIEYTNTNDCTSMIYNSTEEPKQETLEEFINSQPYYGSCTDEYKEGIEVGAKWQQERMYSEEDMMDYSNYRLLIKKALTPKEWFKQFKNK